MSGGDLLTISFHFLSVRAAVVPCMLGLWFISLRFSFFLSVTTVTLVIYLRRTVDWALLVFFLVSSLLGCIYLPTLLYLLPLSSVSLNLCV